MTALPYLFAAITLFGFTVWSVRRDVRTKEDKEE